MSRGGLFFYSCFDGGNVQYGAGGLCFAGAGCGAYEYDWVSYQHQQGYDLVDSGNQTFTITPKALTATLTGTNSFSKVYDGGTINGGITLPKDILLGSTLDTRTVVVRGGNSYRI